MADDRRGAHRRNAFTFGAVQIGGSETACLVWDATEAGAQIEVEAPDALPDRFGLRLRADAPARPATVAWRRSRRIGVAFEV
jgi:hypothetical protein